LKRTIQKAVRVTDR